MVKRLTMLLAGLFLMTGVALAQSTVTGTVVDDNGEPIVGAAVRVAGTKTGTVTDIDGHFSIAAPENSKLTVSYLGMKEQTVKAGQNIRVALSSDDKTLDEVVVTGYGVTKKTAFTGAAATLGSDQIAQKVDPNPIKSLEGTVPGLQMSIGSGQPGAPATIFIRGRNSLNSGTQPLYVIDGVAFDNDEVGIRKDEGATTSPLSTINAQDIENITVLKDATATSIYGARAANGVIVITTKHGKSGKPKVNFNMRLGWNEMPSYTDKYKLVGADKNIELATEALLNSYNKYGENSTFGSYAPVFGITSFNKETAEEFYDQYTGGWVSNYRKTGQQTNWMDEITRKGLIQSYSLDVSGGGANDHSPVYYASMAYDKNNSFMMGKDLKRYSFRFNFDQQASKIVKYGFNTNLSYTKTNNGAGGGYFSDPLTQVYMMSPMTNVYTEEGKYNYDTTTGYNPVALRGTNGDENVAKQYRVLLSPYVQINFTPDLYFLSRGGLDLYLIDEFGYWSFNNDQGKDMNGMGENANTTRNLLSITNTLNYVKTFGGKHHLNLMLGQEGQRKHYKQAYLAASNYPVVDRTDVGLASTPSEARTIQSILKLNSYFFNGQYDYDNKYYGSVSLRTDGSSRFAKGHRWGTFWSVGGKYRISAEKFMQPVSNWLTNFDIRVSYGTTGNQEVGDEDYALGYFASKGLYEYGYNYNNKGGINYVQAANDNLSWEKTGKFNVGIDFTLFDRVNVTADYYNHQTTDMVFKVPLSFTTGLSSYYMNIGKLENQGFEFGVNANLYKSKDINWNASWNGSINKNKVKKLSTDNPIEGTVQITEVGRPIYQWKMKEYAGVDPKTGDAMWYLNETGDETTKDYNKAAKRYLGDANPKFYGSFGTTLDIYGFDLSLQFNYSTGAKIYGNNLRYDLNNGSSFYENYTNYVYDNRWTHEGQITDVPRMDTDGSYANKASSRFLMDGDYLKIRNLSVGYTLPRSIVSHIGLSKVRVFFEGENLYTFTASNYIGFDPAGIDANGDQWWNYPQARSFVFGLTVGF